MTEPGLVYTWKDDPYSSHRVALDWITALPPETRILDIGCAQGLLGARLERNPQRLVGVEPNPLWAAQAAQYYGRVINQPFEALADETLAGYDLVVMLDVLEHMAEPETALRRVRRVLPPDGRLILSVPNVAHLYVRLNLLAGRFEYQERGILDRTHLKFFTRASITRLAQRCGFRIVRESATPVPLPLVHPFFERARLGRGLHAFNAWSARLWPALLGYQILLLAESEK